MKQLIYILILVGASLAYLRVKSTSFSSLTTTQATKRIYSLEQGTGRVTFQKIEQVVQNRKQNAWVEFSDSAASLALHFDPQHKDTLSVSYSSECWLYYPYTIEDSKTIVYWDRLIDSKYSDFDILKAIRRTIKKSLGKPFMVLELANDTTLKATYLIPDLVKKINSSSKERVFFPAKFTVSQEFYL